MSIFSIIWLFDRHVVCEEDFGAVWIYCGMLLGVSVVFAAVFFLPKVLHYDVLVYDC